ncbi:MAG TPA: c-type cytochrome [Terriglobales bacterium]|nr:c-type cytochrome [Terriglobales bacterium]
MNNKFLFGLTVILLLTSLASWANDGATLYKTKCAGCHGASGEGKPTMKAPPLKGTNLEVDQLVEHITKGESESKPPHNKGIVGVNGDQAKAIAEYIKTLK